jgi:hypothetical protein
METERGGDAPYRAERRAGPYDAAVELTAEERPYAPWVRSINDYERKETTLVEGLRYG